MIKIHKYFYNQIKNKNLNHLIKLDDKSCWIKYINHNWIYNKLELAKKQMILILVKNYKKKYIKI